MQHTKISKLLAMVLAVFMLISLAACQTKEAGGDQSSADETTVEEKRETSAKAEETVTVKIICDDTVPEDVWEKSVILDQTEYSFDGEVNAFTALTELTKENSIDIVHSDGYVTGIGGLSAMDAGENSGWMFQVNGELASVGAQDYILCDGDELVWFYTADYNTYFN